MNKTVLLLTLLFSMLSINSAFSQSDSNAVQQDAKQIIKERRDAAKLSEEAIEKKSIKEARKQAKALEKDGWKPAPGSVSIDKQLSELLLRQYSSTGNFPKYIIGKSSAKAATYGVARRQAIARAKVDIVSNMQTEVAALTEITDVNTELSDGEVQTIAKMVDTSKQLIQQSLGKTDVVLEIFREKGNTVEVQIGLSYDGKLAKSTLLELFDKDNADIKSKLEQLTK